MLDEDARIVLDGMSLKNVDLDVAMNAIIGSLLKNGYLDEVCNVINVCVENDDEEAGEALGQKLKEEITLLLDENEVVGKVRTQTYAADEETAAQAQFYGVSEGKLALAKQVSENMGTQLEDTIELSITELRDLSDAESTELITKETEDWSATEPESRPEEMPIVKPSTEPEEFPGERPSREPGERPEIESGEKPGNINQPNRNDRNSNKNNNQQNHQMNGQQGSGQQGKGQMNHR